MDIIKQRKSVISIKTLDKAKILPNHMKNTFIKTKSISEEAQCSEHDTSHAYAVEAASEKTMSIGKSTAYRAERFGRKSFKDAPDTILRTKAGAMNIKKRINGSVKAIKKTVKTKKNAQTVIKTSKQVARSSSKAARATVKTSQRAAQAARATAKATFQTAKLTVKAVAAAIKATVSAVKGLVSLIVAGGWIAVIIILIICIVGFLLSSPFGLFYSDEKTSGQGSMVITSAIMQINNELTAKIIQIENEYPHDEVDGATTPQNWKNVLAVYAVKYAADLQNSVGIMTMDETKLVALKAVFWDMNRITFTVEKVESEFTSGQESIQPQGKTILHITVLNKSCSDMAALYAFNSEQRGQLDELLKSEYDSFWDALLNHDL